MSIEPTSVLNEQNSSHHLQNVSSVKNLNSKMHKDLINLYGPIPEFLGGKPAGSPKLPEIKPRDRSRNMSSIDPVSPSR
jgi:hypothetical protein